MYASDSPLDNEYHGGGPLLPPEGRDSLRAAGKWGRFLGIVAMVTLGLTIAFLLVIGGTLLTFGGEYSGDISAWMMPVVIIYGGLFALMLYLAYLLYRFGAKAMIAVDTDSTAALTSSFGSLARMLKIMGILTAIQLVFTGISLAFMLLSGASSIIGNL